MLRLRQVFSLLEVVDKEGRNYSSQGTSRFPVGISLGIRMYTYLLNNQVDLKYLCEDIQLGRFLVGNNPT